MGSQMFWKDTWLGEEKLSGRSGRLFQNSLHKEARVGEMGNWVSENWE